LKGQRYWLVVLNPIGPGSLNLRDAGIGGSRLLSAQKGLAAFPRNWVSGDVAPRSPLSAAVVQVPPEVTLMGLSADAVVTGSARLTWTTDVLADAQVEYGTTTSYGLLTPLDVRVDWRHDMQLTGLAPGTIYHYRVRSRDAAGALSTSLDATFFTAEP